MHLKPDELAMLNGEEGQLLQEAMKYLVRFGEAFGAEEMIDIKFSNTYWVASIRDVDPSLLPPVLDRKLIEDFINDGRRVKIPTVRGNEGEDRDLWREMGVPEKLHEISMKDYAIARKLGIQAAGTCAPYLVVDMNEPTLGTHIVSVESSAITFYNSVLGARCERSGISTWLAALTGKYPKIGYHLDENRYATIRFDVTVPLRDIADFGCLGQFAGEICGLKVPVFTGIASANNPELMSLSAAVATGGAVSLFHIPGITPEFRTVEDALNYKEPEAVYEFGEKELKEIYARWSGMQGEKVDTVFLGCPHFNIYQLGKMADLLRGKKKQDDVLFILTTGCNVKYMGEKMSYVKDITDSGALLLASTCPITGLGVPGPRYVYAHPEYTTGTLVTDSMKAAVYAKSSLGARKVILGNTEDCVQAAITGKWRQS